MRDQAHKSAKQVGQGICPTRSSQPGRQHNMAHTGRTTGAITRRDVPCLIPEITRCRHLLCCNRRCPARLAWFARCPVTCPLVGQRIWEGIQADRIFRLFLARNIEASLTWTTTILSPCGKGSAFRSARRKSKGSPSQRDTAKQGTGATTQTKKPADTWTQRSRRGVFLKSGQSRPSICGNPCPSPCAL